MRPITTPGETRRIGESQGYIGLSLRDETINDSVTGSDTPVMVSTWRPSPDELKALNEGMPVVLRIVGRGHPPVMLGVAGVGEF